MNGLLKTRRNPLIGALIAPAAPLIVLWIITLAITGQISDIIQGAHMIFPISYPASLMLGAPVAYMLIKIGKNHWWHYAISGALMSMIAVFIILIIPLTRLGSPFTHWNSLYTTIALMMAASGPIVATTFWAVTRPDLAGKK